jgi:hypothetical protein
MYGGREALAYKAPYLDIAKKFVKELPMVKSEVEEIEIVPPEENKNITAAFFTLCYLNSASLTPENDTLVREYLKNSPRETVLETLELLAKYGVIPPVEKLQGGVRSSPRPKKPSLRAKLFKEDAEETARSILLSREQDRLRKERQELAEKTRADVQARLESSDGPLKQFDKPVDGLIQDLINNLSRCETHEPSVFLRALFPEPSISVWQHVVTKSYRDIWELHSEDTQCNAVLSSNGIDEECYICGLTIEEKTGQRNSLGPSCEHILPVMQAMFFLDLYRSSDGPLTSAKRAFLQMEYAWSHLCCNLVKNVTSLLKTVVDVNNFPSWEFDETNTTQMLTTIFKTNTHGSGALLSKLPRGTNIDTWITQRVDSIKTNKMDKIVAYIKSKGVNGGVIALMGLKNCVNPKNIDARFLEILEKYQSGTLEEFEKTKAEEMDKRLSNIRRAKIVMNTKKNFKPLLKTTKFVKKRKGGNKITQRRKDDYL